MKADAKHLLDDPGLARVLGLLNGNGEEARVVGGAIRNALLDRPGADVDISTSATPETVIARAKSAGLRTIPTGLAHGTVTLLVEGRPFEVTTLREDIETDGRHAKIRFGRDFALDAMRRDFTINALSMGPDGTVHDYTGGLDDLAVGRVRFIGEPEKRIREDYLRILRFFRFSADYAAGELDAEGLTASIRERDGLRRLSRERVRQELFKLLVARQAVAAITAMTDSGLLGTLLHAVPQPGRLARLLAIDSNTDATLRLAALAAVVREDADRLRDALRLSNAEAKRIESATMFCETLHGREAPPSLSRLREFLFLQGRSTTIDSLRLVWASSRVATTDAGWASALRFAEDTPEPQMPFSGADLMARGVASGKPLGEALKRLQADWIRAGFPKDPRSLAVLLQEVCGPT